MKIFVIHKAEQRKIAESLLNASSRNIGIKVNFIFLKESLGKEWKARASTKISDSELCVIFNPSLAKKSENVNWELEKAASLGKRVLEFEQNGDNSDLLNAIKSSYYFDQEFDENFNKKGCDESVLELYKIMVSSSESLMSRRQAVNSFFWTVVAAIFACIGYLWIQKIHDNFTFAVFLVPLVLGFFVAHSWRSLLLNYGRLNRGKFRVINKIEEELPISIFSAEWVALGKGARPEIYQSFTETEALVPRIIFWIFLILFSLIVVYLIFENVEGIYCNLINIYYLYFGNSFFW